MKIGGSKHSDTLVGTIGDDTIIGKAGSDLIATHGGRDEISAGSGNDMITGFAFDMDDIRSSDYLGSRINGGKGFDTAIVELAASAKATLLDAIKGALQIKSVEEFIFNVSGLSTDKQIVIGTKFGETVNLGDSDAHAMGMEGNDYLYSGGGDDTLNGGAGQDFLSAGDGHNYVTGGGGRDYFHFGLSSNYQYTEIQDFKNGKDKIAVSIAVDQFNLIYDAERETPDPLRGYGDYYYGVGPAINNYVSYNNGRHFDAETFHADRGLFDDFITFDQSTGSILINHFEEIDDAIYFERVLVAQVDTPRALTADDFVFYVM